MIFDSDIEGCGEVGISIFSGCYPTIHPKFYMDYSK
jgi:hypothetical protein